MPELSRRRFLTTAGATASAALAAEFLPINVRQALASGPQHGTGRLSDIKHVVVLMQENRSFDHYFGALPGVRGFSGPAAITLSTGRSVFYQPVQTSAPAGTSQYSNPDGYLLPFHLDSRTTNDLQMRGLRPGEDVARCRSARGGCQGRRREPDRAGVARPRGPVCP